MSHPTPDLLAARDDLAEVVVEDLGEQLAVTDCVGLTNCQSGFCTRACVDPTTDCEPSPGGTAAPACVMFETQMLCALPCDGGETCPTPMACTSVTGGSVCA
jgi:hypothetical protein